MKLLQGIQSDIERISKIITNLEAAAQEPGRNQAPALAQFLSQFYTGLETCLEKKLRLKGIPLPSPTAQYHQALLHLAVSRELLPPSCIQMAADLLGFRHYARHAYGIDFRPDEVRQKAKIAEKAWAEIKPLWASELAAAQAAQPPLP